MAIPQEVVAYGLFVNKDLFDRYHLLAIGRIRVRRSPVGHNDGGLSRQKVLPLALNGLADRVPALKPLNERIEEGVYVLGSNASMNVEQWGNTVLFLFFCMGVLHVGMWLDDPGFWMMAALAGALPPLLFALGSFWQAVAVLDIITSDAALSLYSEINRVISPSKSSPSPSMASLTRAFSASMYPRSIKVWINSKPGRM